MSEPSPEGQLWKLMQGALVARTLGLVADLGVADRLTAGPKPVAELAKETGADPDTLHRFLRALASDGVFDEVSPGIFRNTPASEALLGTGWREFAHLFGGAWHRAAGELDATGRPSFPRAFGSDFWSWLEAHPDERGAFDRAMVDGLASRVERLASVEWGGDETVVDIGGGNGSLLIGFLAGQPGLRGIVFDLPETVRDEASFGDRIEFVAGSFFEGVPKGEVFVLSTVLHNWPDDQAAAILRAIHAAAPDEGRLLVLDRVVPPDDDRPGARWFDLLGLALFASHERTGPEWRSLLAETGFEPVSMRDGLIEAVCR